MSRYLAQRTFPDRLQIPMTEEGAATCSAVAQKNADLSGAWAHSYVSRDKNITYCI
jgi:hypothetical protein